MVFPRPPAETAPVAPTGRRRRRRREREQTAETGRQQSARRAEEGRRQRLAIIIGALLILAILAIVAVGYYREFYQPPRTLAGQVRDIRFTMGDLVDRIRVLQGVNRYQGGRVDLSTVPFEYLQDMIHAEILRQASPGLGFSVTDADVSAELERRFKPTPPPGQEVDAGQLQQEYENALTNFQTATRLSEEEYRVLVEEDLLRRQLFIVIGSGLPEQIEQVEAAWIRLETDGPVDPQEVRDRLEREDFAVVAAEVHRSAGFTNPQGYAGWVPPEAFPDLDETLFGNPDRERDPLPVGEISNPVFTQDGTYIVHKISGPEEQELSDVMAFQLSRERVDQWFNDQLSQGSDDGWLKINFDSERYAWVADQVQLSAPRMQQPPPGQPAGPGFP